MATAEYSDEQLNFFRLCHIVTDEVAESLRLFFKKEWDRLYKEDFGEWKDLPKNGNDFYEGESLSKQEFNAEQLAIMINGNTAEWDCTKLFYAICYSDCIGRYLKRDYKIALNILRKIRNECHAHSLHGKINDAEFQCIIQQVEDAFKALDLSRDKIQVIREQTSFPTNELKNVLKKVENLKQELEVLEAQLNKDVSSFYVLPPKPSHDVVDRDREVAKIAKQLEELKEANENRLSYLYISGNPGSGKSQLAGLVAKRFFDEGTQIPFTSSFVMTIDAKTPSTILESYVSLARKIKCPEYSITNTLNSTDLNSGEKITDLKTLISEKIELYTTWLLVVDNVESISKIYTYLPASGNEKWARGQLLITTQDTASVPPMSPFVNHVSVSEGMEPNDAVYLLETVSGISGCETEEVARKLDYHPLTLARAAAYVREVRDIKGGANSGWSDYFEKLKEGRIVASDAIVVDPVDPNSMGEVTRLAVKKEIESTNVIIKYLFTLLFFCVPQPLSLKIVTNYIRNVAEEMDDIDAISVKIQRCSLIIFYSEEKAFFIRIHQVVHDAIRAVLKDYLKADKLGAMKAAIKSFYQFVEDTRQQDHLSYLDTYAKYSQCIPHLEVLITQIKDNFAVEETRNATEITFKSDIYYLQTLGVMCQEHCAFQAAKECFNIVLNIRLKHLKPDDLDVGRTYSNLGAAHGDLLEHEEAKECYNRALTIFQRKFGLKHVEVGIMYKNLGDEHRYLSDFIEAKEYYDLALPILRKEFGPEHPIVGITYKSLGQVHQDLSNFNQAKVYYDLALPILREEFEPEEVEVRQTYRYLGDVHHRLSDFIQAKEYYDLALSLYQKDLGPEEDLVGIIHMTLGNVLEDLGELNQAKESYDRALLILLKELGPEHADVGMTYTYLGNVHLELSDFIQAKEYYNLALPILRKEFGPEDADVGVTYKNLGDVHQNLYDFIKAKEYYNLALPIYQETFGPESAKVGITYMNLGDVHKNLSDFIRAKEYYDLALPILREEFEAEEAEVRQTYKNLGDVHRKLSDFIQAKKYYDLALPLYQKVLGPEKGIVGIIHMALGKVLKNLGDLNQAKESYDRALPILRKEYGPEHADVGMTYMNLGDVHVKLSDFIQAKECYDRSLPILLKEFRPEYCLFKMIKENLVKIKQLQENSPRSSGSFGKRPTGSGHPGSVPAKRSKKM